MSEIKTTEFSSVWDSVHNSLLTSLSDSVQLSVSEYVRAYTYYAVWHSVDTYVANPVLDYMEKLIH